MNKLEKARLTIDEIDTEIIKLFEKRMTVVKDVIEFKIENGMPILDSNREANMLEKNLKKISNEEYKKYYSLVLEGFLNASKVLQKDILEKNK